MRPRLRVDFVREHARRPWLPATLLIAGAVATLSAGVAYRALAGEVERLEQSVADTKRLARRELPRLREAPTDPKRVAEEVRAANVVLAQLTIPWGALFRELEAAGGDGIALLSVQPDASTGALRLTGEARRFEDVLAYVSRLEARDALAGVFLTGHEVRSGGALRPVAFALVARWAGRE